MNTLKQLSLEPLTIPTRTSWYLADLSESRGKQDLFTHQSPQKLKVLREHALIESAVSSNRIEGVEVSRSRIGTLIFGKPALKDRDEEEIRGYRDALRLIHERGADLSITEKTIKELHKLCRGEIWDAGQYKSKEVNIIQKYAGGQNRIRFKTVPPKKTPKFMDGMVNLWKDGLREKWVHPLILVGALNLDFLCIHPFRDGNGRVSRILLLLSLYHLGYEVGRYISLERLIESNKERYYETLEQSSQGWHDGKHDPWPYLNYILYIMNMAYKEFERRVGQLSSPRGSKTTQIEESIDRQKSSFRVADLQRECPGVSVDLIRHVLKRLSGRKVKCLGRGQQAKWQKMSN